MLATSQCKTLSYSNEFRFICPIFGSEERLADCLRMYDLLKLSKRTPGREGCNACQASGKCPTYRIEKGTLHGHDHYFSAEPRVGNLRPELLDAIAPIVTLDTEIERFGVPPDQLALIRATDGRMGKLAGKGSKGVHMQLAKPELPAARAKTKPKPKDDADKLVEAAAAGDMSAAINRVMEREAAPVASVREIEPDHPPAAQPAPAPAIPKSEGRPMSLLERARQQKEKAL